MGGDHVFAAAAAHDPVPNLPGAGYLSLLPVIGLGTLGAAALKYAADAHHLDDGSPFGTNPARAAFGGTPFSVAAGPPGSTHTPATGTTAAPPTGPCSL